MAGGQLDQGVVARRIERITVIPQLDHHSITAEQFDEPTELLGSGGRTVIDECRRHRPLAAPGEHPAMAGHDIGDVGHGELRRALLAGKMAEAQSTGEAGVTGWPVGEHEEVIRAGWPGLASASLRLLLAVGLHLAVRRPTLCLGVLFAERHS